MHHSVMRLGKARLETDFTEPQTGVWRQGQAKIMFPGQ